MNNSSDKQDLHTTTCETFFILAKGYYSSANLQTHIYSFSFTMFSYNTHL